MTHFSSFRRPGLLVSLLGLSSFALLGAACSGVGTPGEPAGEHVDSAESALTDAQCAYFDVNGQNQICHYTGSASHPYTILKTSEQGCINGHAGHAGDYITSTDPTSPTYDPTCQGGGCLPAGAPTDATLACCNGLVSQNGTCVDPCAAQPCQNGGTCAASGTSYTCACAPGFTGANCETTIDNCAAQPCQNGGTCTNGVNSYTCSCPAGFTGTSCETDIDDCAPNPCQNGGTCADGVNSYTCSCAAGYQGSVCQNLVGCVSGLPTAAGFWKGESNANDSSGNGVNGTLRGATFAAGQVGQAFNTTLGDVAITTAAPAFASLNAITIDMWININDATGGQTLFARNRGVGGTGYALSLNAGQLGFAVNNGVNVNQAFNAPVSLPLDTWHHITVSRNANVVKMYVNCALIAQTTTFFPSTINLSAALPLTIGSEDTVPNRRFRGLIDEVSFYPTELSAPEIDSICTAAAAGVCVP